MINKHTTQVVVKFFIVFVLLDPTVFNAVGSFFDLNSRMKDIDQEITDLRLHAIELTLKDLYLQDEQLKTVIKSQQEQEQRLNDIINSMCLQIAILEHQLAKEHGDFKTDD